MDGSEKGQDGNEHGEMYRQWENSWKALKPSSLKLLLSQSVREEGVEACMDITGHSLGRIGGEREGRVGVCSSSSSGKRPASVEEVLSEEK